ncbi:MAG: Veg family protein [Lachnospirales bacterium]
MIYQKDIQRAKNDVEKCLGSRVKVRFNTGRKKMSTTEGILKKAYGSVFSVEYSLGRSDMHSATYSYKDIVTKDVQITLL